MFESDTRAFLYILMALHKKLFGDNSKLARDSGRQHKAWGGAQRNPRNCRPKDRSPRSGRQTEITINTVARSAGWHGFGLLTWGSAALHPRLYAFARYRGLGFSNHRWKSSRNSNLDFLCKAHPHPPFGNGSGKFTTWTQRDFATKGGNEPLNDTKDTNDISC